MRKSILVLSALVFVGWAASPLAGPVEEVAQIAGPRNQMFEEGNADALVSAFADNAVLTSSLSGYRIEGEVAATPLLVIFDDGSGKPALYAVGGETKRTPVTRQGARMSYQHPIDAPFIVWEGDKLTATLDGAFIDYWEKVK